jgi:hypothetical protein
LQHRLVLRDAHSGGRAGQRILLHHLQADLRRRGSRGLLARFRLRARVLRELKRRWREALLLVSAGELGFARALDASRITRQHLDASSGT